MGVIIVVPATTLFLLFFCPESPVWLLSKGRDEEAKKALTRLRGADNADIIQAEFNRISTNWKIIQKESEIDQNEITLAPKISQFFSLFIDPTFVKPFSYLLMIFCLGFEWTGFPAIGFYMVPLLT